MGNNKSVFLGHTDDLTCVWCKKLFTRPVTLGCGHSLCWACAARVRDRKIKPRCRYKDCRMEIRDITFVVNRTLDKMVQRVKKLKNTSVDENGDDSGVDQNSIASSCSTDSMDPPPCMSPAGTSESGLNSSKTAETCDDRERCESVITQHEGSVHTANGSLDKENTEARGSVPVSICFSDGDSRFKDIQSGGSTSGFCSEGSMYAPPDMAPPWPRGPRSVCSRASSDVCSVEDSGAEEFETPAPGRTTTGHGCDSRSLLFPHPINIDPFTQKPGSDQGVIPKQMTGILHPERRHTLPSLIPQGEPGLKSKESDKKKHKRGWKSEIRDRVKQIIPYSKRSSGKRSTMDPIPESTISESCWTLYITGTNVNPGLRDPISRPTSMDPLPKQSSHRQFPVTPPPTSLDRRSVRLDQGINVIYEIHSPIRPGCRTDSLESISELPVIQKSTLPAADVCTSSNKNKVKKTSWSFPNPFKSGKSSH